MGTVPEYVGSTSVELMSIWEDVKFFRVTKVLSVCTRTRVFNATIVVWKSLKKMSSSLKLNCSGTIVMPGMLFGRRDVRNERLARLPDRRHFILLLLDYA